METITVSTIVRVPRERAWELWTVPEHIVQWCFASDDWHAPRAENNLRVGGTFVTRMEAKDGSVGFDFGGAYTEVVPQERIAYSADDGRKVIIMFTEKDSGTEITELFEPENENPVEMQRGGWQSILDNFRKYAERGEA